MAQGLAVGGMALSAFGTLAAYSGEKKAGKRAQQAADWEAALHDQEAKFIEYETQIALKRQKREATAAIAGQRADFGSQGFVVNSGSNRVITDAGRGLADYDAAVIRWMGNVGAWKERMTATQVRLAGQSMGTISNLRATGTLLSGAASLMRQGSDYYQQYRTPAKYTTQKGK